MRVHPRLTRFTPCWAALPRVKAAKSQRPKGTPIQSETIYCFYKGAAVARRPRPTGADGAGLPGGLVNESGSAAAAASAAALNSYMYTLLYTYIVYDIVFDIDDIVHDIVYNCLPAV